MPISYGCNDSDIREGFSKLVAGNFFTLDDLPSSKCGYVILGHASKNFQEKGRFSVSPNVQSFSSV